MACFDNGDEMLLNDADLRWQVYGIVTQSHHQAWNAMSLRPQSHGAVPTETQRVAEAIFPNGNLWCHCQCGG